MLTYHPELSPRLLYAFDLLGKLAGIRFQWTHDLEAYLDHRGHKLFYGELGPLATNVNIGYSMPCCGLLKETGIRKDLRPAIGKFKDEICLFDMDGALHGFDVAAAVFYVASRYEEYQPFSPDEYGRFPYKSSIAHRYGFLHKAMANRWALGLADAIAAFFGSDIPDRKPSVFRFAPTYDIDIAYSFKHHPIWKNLGGLGKDLLKRDVENAIDRSLTVIGGKKDPFDVYDWLEGLREKHGLKPVYFFLMAREKGKYDKNLSPDSPAMAKLVQRLSQHNKIGLHPSWISGDRPGLLSKEKNDLEKALGGNIPIAASRQHYIRFDLPGTYQRLIASGITEDHSMGYGSANGFRASVANAFHWYDLEKESCTGLLIRPFCFMDANAYFEERLSPEEAFGTLMGYVSETKAVGGELVTVFHNHFLTENLLWQPWRELYERFLASISGF